MKVIPSGRTWIRIPNSNHLNVQEADKDSYWDWRRNTGASHEEAFHLVVWHLNPPPLLSGTGDTFCFEVLFCLVISFFSCCNLFVLHPRALKPPDQSKPWIPEPWFLEPVAELPSCRAFSLFVKRFYSYRFSLSNFHSLILFLRALERFFVVNIT